MKMDATTFSRLRDAIVPLFNALSKDKRKEQLARIDMADMWTLASKAGCLAWLYDTPQRLNDDHISTALEALRKQILQSL